MPTLLLHYYFLIVLIVQFDLMFPLVPLHILLQNPCSNVFAFFSFHSAVLFFCFSSIFSFYLLLCSSLLLFYIALLRTSCLSIQKNSALKNCMVGENLNWQQLRDANNLPLMIRICKFFLFWSLQTYDTKSVSTPTRLEQASSAPFCPQYLYPVMILFVSVLTSGKKKKELLLGSIKTKQKWKL